MMLLTSKYKRTFQVNFDCNINVSFFHKIASIFYSCIYFSPWRQSGFCIILLDYLVKSVNLREKNLQMVPHLSTIQAHSWLTLLIWEFPPHCLNFWLMLFCATGYPIFSTLHNTSMSQKSSVRVNGQINKVKQLWTCTVLRSVTIEGLFPQFYWFY